MARILLADDDEDMVEICSRLLPRRGHEVIVARDGADAVDKAKTTSPDIILMDMRMPVSAGGQVNDQAGIEATRQIKAIPEIAGIPVLALTGHMMTKFKENITQVGCVDMVPKPIEDFGALLAMIDRHLRPAPK